MGPAGNANGQNNYQLKYLSRMKRQLTIRETRIFRTSAVGLMLLGSYPASAVMAMYPEAPACPVHA